MAFGNRNKKGGKSSGGSKGGGKKKSNYKKLGSIMESKKYKGMFFAADKYHGCLLFVSKEDQRIYKVGNCSFTSKEDLEDRGIENLPDSLVGNVSMNLDNAEEVDLEKIDSLEDLFEDDSGDDD